MQLIQDIIAACQEARHRWGIPEDGRSQFGDCGIVSANAMALLHARYTVRLDGGYFIFDPTQDDSDGEIRSKIENLTNHNWGGVREAAHEAMQRFPQETVAT